MKRTVKYIERKRLGGVSERSLGEEDRFLREFGEIVGVKNLQEITKDIINESIDK